MNRKRGRGSRWLLGFTVTEMLAVSAIITSIPTGAYVRAKQKAHEMTCANNLRQIGQAIVMYHLSEGVYPKAAFFPEDALKSSDSIMRILQESGSGIPAEMWICPSAPDVLRERGLTFVYNDTFGGRQSLRDPSKAWLLIEVNCVSKKVPAPHPAGYNILFADGHVLTTNQLPPSITAKQQAALQRLLQNRRG